MDSTRTQTDRGLDVERLMLEIREAAIRREIEVAASVAAAFVPPPLELFAPSPAPPPLELQPPFDTERAGHYHVDDLLKYHDAAFVHNAYLALLKRLPDPTGFDEKLTALREGKLNKIDVLASLRYSPEGRAKNVRLDGLRLPYTLRRAGRVPFIGYLLKIVIIIARLPNWMRSQRQFEAYVVSQQQAIAAHVDVNIREAIRAGDEDAARRVAHAEHQARRLEEHAQKLEERVAHLSRLVNQYADASSKLLKNSVAELKHEMRKHHAAPENARGDIAHTAHARDLDELYASFQREFRGSKESVKERLRVHLAEVEAAGVRADALDLGCGRGEWLELLATAGVAALGVDSNAVDVRACRHAGLDVTEADLIEHLRGVPDDSVNLITIFHVVEHLSFEALVEFADEALRALRPGGLLIIETPNPKNLVVGACNFYSDPTHRQPVFPETLRFVLRQRGFASVELRYLNAVEGSPFDHDDAAGRMLDGWFFGARDFAAVARKPHQVEERGE